MLTHLVDFIDTILNKRKTIWIAVDVFDKGWKAYSNRRAELFCRVNFRCIGVNKLFNEWGFGWLSHFNLRFLCVIEVYKHIYVL